MQRQWLTIVFALALCTTGFAAEADLIGTWALQSTDEQGQTRHSVLRVRQDGTSLSAKFRGETGEAPVTDLSYTNGELRCTVTVTLPDTSSLPVRLTAKPLGDAMTG